MVYSKILFDKIEREKSGIDYCCSDEDRAVLQRMFNEINQNLGTNVCYLAEMDSFIFKGSGRIISEYISQISSETVKAYLIPQLVSDKITDCDKLLLQMYMQFRTSGEYISKAGDPAPAHIYTRYDNAFKTIKPKRIKSELLSLAQNPRDFFYLPFTMRMLASWKIPDLKTILIAYSDDQNITPINIGIEDCDSRCLPPFTFIKREIRFTAIEGLKFYPSDDIRELMYSYLSDPDSVIRAMARKTLNTLEDRKEGQRDGLREP